MVEGFREILSAARDRDVTLLGIEGRAE